ncbi:aldo/keto reductase [Rubellicoccus peritrichatus]|uniref:Aldo/keto reductase n=1 Tax=Rubellicoccus peritrichatus TaxID=3080537 RepID=A0AAQ3QRD4_9BACT|nr:aldo/keto reductase [Puniceicoccus sp. CR14]WOO41213.1 aldo/keto reductase [Puniceicoccus sp. CR14]
MESISLGKSDLMSSRLVYGCMRLVGDNSSEIRNNGKVAVRTAIDEGYTHFDHADIYGKGKCEELFAEVLKETPGLRDRIILTSKCAVRFKGDPNEDDPNRYDFNKTYIKESVDGILSRLDIDHLDILLLHRPDFLFDAEDVADTFQGLQTAGKVLNFGVSNFTPSQVSLLQSRCSMPLLVNQVEINIHNISSILDGTLDQCQELNISPQAWCPIGGVAYAAWGNTFTVEEETRIKFEFDRQSKKYDTEDWIIMLAWLLKHPSKILPIVGSTTPARIKAAKKALDLNYTHEDWYALMEARTGKAYA